MKFAINGAMGRMGRAILTLASQDPEIEIIGASDLECARTGNDIGETIGIGTLGVLLSNGVENALAGAETVIDFTTPAATLKTASLCASSGIPLVAGTTGFTAEERAEFERIVSPIPCVFAPNMSVGVNLLFKLVAETAAILDGDYDAEITEVHHRFKKDAPSGTARRLAEIIAETRNTPLDTYGVYGREGITGERRRNEIGIHAIRAGDVVGEHTVTFCTLGERIELVHKAHSRDALARGAIIAAKFAVKAKPGLYDMQDVLGFQ